MSSEVITIKRHSMAHIMAKAVMEAFPDVKLAFGPAIENGFYYDFDFGENKIESKDLNKIEKNMKKIIQKSLSFIREELSFEEVLKLVKGKKQFYKEQHVQKLHEEGINTFSIYKTGEFVDLCEGPHVENTSQLNNMAFCLDRISGAYWLNSEKNKMLTRVYALCFETAEELESYLKQREKALEWDHKKLGKELDLFFVNEVVGKGLILWTPNGTVLRDEIEKYAKEMEFKYGYVRVATPHISKEELFLQSGHLPAYKESMFPPMTVMENGEMKEKFYLKPMNCPFHHLIYAEQPRSYRDLPLRLAEYGTDYRFEQSGELSGLLRVRCMTMNDAHIYAAEESLETELKDLFLMYEECYRTFELKNFSYRFSIRGKENKEKFIGDPILWDKAESILEKLLKEMNIPYYTGEGEAAFYGPKIDIQFKNLMGREETVSTIQIDFQGPVKFDLHYVDNKGELKRPVIIHRSPLSTHERFISFLIEHYGGAFPLWMAPVQVMIIPINPVLNEYCRDFEKTLRKLFIRAKCDFSENSFNKKIMNHVTKKIPLMLIVGNKEAENNQVTVRRYGIKEQKTMTKVEFLGCVMNEIKSRIHVRS